MFKHKRSLDHSSKWCLDFVFVRVFFNNDHFSVRFFESMGLIDSFDSHMIMEKRRLSVIQKLLKG